MLNIVWLTSLKYLISGPVRKNLLSPTLKKINESLKLEVIRKDMEEKKKIISEIEATLATNLKYMLLK